MHQFSSLADFTERTRGTKKWVRTAEAIEAAPNLLRLVTYSIGDSITWRRIDETCADDALVASRRYQRVLYCAGGTAHVEYAPTAQLRETRAYSDLTDRQSFAGPGVTVPVGAGTLLIFDIDEATRLTPGTDFDGVQVRVTVEGHSFHNK